MNKEDEPYVLKVSFFYMAKKNEGCSSDNVHEQTIFVVIMTCQCVVASDGDWYLSQ